jgi:cysteinyl-tRNA synthetase
MIWDSPWGTGRPGWHIEDTAITETYFGTQYDIHGGGLDLIFPHHEAEIAQMEAASGKKPMVRYWMHTGFLNVKGEKMSKSIGNFITINELLDKYSPEVFRFFVLSTHYRSPIDFSNEILEQSSHGLQRIYKLIENINEALDGDTSISLENDQDYIQKLSDTREEFFDAMDNDFNTPAAFSTIFDIIRDVNRDLDQVNISKNSLTKLKAIILEFGYVLGLDFSLNQDTDETLEDDLLDLLKYVRDKLRDEKNWELSDEIRSKLKEMNIILEDKKS